MTRIRLFAGSASIALAASLAAPAWADEVRGIVAAASDTDALQAAEVRIEELGRRAVTDRDGSYSFDDVPAGSYTITARYIDAEPL